MNHTEHNRLTHSLDSLVEQLVEKYGVQVDDAWALVLEHAKSRLEYRT